MMGYVYLPTTKMQFKCLCKPRHERVKKSHVNFRSGGLRQNEKISTQTTK